jgi:hypothetical protein
MPTDNQLLQFYERLRAHSHMYPPVAPSKLYDTPHNARRIKYGSHVVKNQLTFYVITRRKSCFF